MAAQLSVAVRNAQADALESAIGTAPILEIRTGAPPANCAAADTGTLIASATLPSDWLTAAANGQKSLSGMWQDLSADATGTPAHFRIKDSGGTTCHMQGTVTVTGGGGDMTMNTVNVAAGQIFTVTAFTWLMGNA